MRAFHASLPKPALNNRNSPFGVFLLGATLLCAFCGTGHAQMAFPSYPPQHWQCSISFDFSQDVFLKFLHSKPSKDEFVPSESLFLWLYDGCRIDGPSSHPALTGTWSKNRISIFGSQTLGFLSQADQALAYSNACAVMKSFSFANSFKHTNYDDSGVDISISMEINGRSMSVSFKKLQQNEDLPAGVGPLLAIMRRNLPSSYSRLFDDLRVPVLPPLPANVAARIRLCELHHEWMKLGTVKIAYGLIEGNEAFSQAQKRLFPNSHSFTLGGCVVSPESPKENTVLYCESCRKAEADWNAQRETKTSKPSSDKPSLDKKPKK